jgi:hypothetical protein
MKRIGEKRRSQNVRIGGFRLIRHSWGRRRWLVEWMFRSERERECAWGLVWFGLFWGVVEIFIDGLASFLVSKEINNIFLFFSLIIILSCRIKICFFFTQNLLLPFHIFTKFWIIEIFDKLLYFYLIN